MRTATVADRLRKPRALKEYLKEYKDALAESRRLMNYFKAAQNALPKAECALLSEFVEISKRKCQRLRRSVERPASKRRSAA